MGAIAKRTPLAEVCETIASADFGQKLAQALPGNVTLDRFQRVTLTAIQQAPSLLDADRQTLYRAVIRCAQDGLYPDGREAALVKFGNEVVYMPMVYGLRKKAADHGFALEAHVVHEHDDFEWELGFTPTIKHKPPRLNVERGEIIGAYAVATGADGRKYLEVMSRADIEVVRSVSRAKNGDLWTKWYGEACRKTVARRLWKMLPLGDVDERTDSVIAANDAEFDLGAAPDPEAAAVLEQVTGLRPPPDDDGPDDRVPADDDPPEPEYEPEHEGNGEPLEGEVIVEPTGQATYADRAAQAQERRRRRESGEA